MKSKATNFTKMALKTLFSTVSHRKTFPDAAVAYNKLRKGNNKSEENIFFYVSSSTWNIYPILKEFLKINNFPEGVILLQDLVTEKRKKHNISHGHKLDRISEIADFYEDLPLLLIGDAGQQDPEIYLQIAEKKPSQIDKILIRNSWWSKIISDPTENLKRAKDIGVEMHYFDSLDEIYSF